MKYAISNIAWRPHEHDAAYSLMCEYNVTGLEIAPSLLLDGMPNPYEASKDKLTKAKDHAASYGINIISMQSILFGATNLSLFESETARQALLNYTKQSIAFAGKLAIPNIVFGSPRNRIIPPEMNIHTAQDIAQKFFNQLGDYAQHHDTCIAIEPNSDAYGGNFLTTTLHTLAFIKNLQHPAIKLNLDMGTMELATEDDYVIEEAFPYIHHVHLSAGYLHPIYEQEISIYKERIHLLKQLGYTGHFSIEMKNISTADNRNHIKKACVFITNLLT